ncbi:hypothetical protein LLEC1_05289 [Akanthomyces lecanii]|uniref:F-box domain-containing protein n=1 Tax=Cordyceps confragosa TaxID=2714763 RepID=A0A179I0A7_CORDF|nr:hypothetical protein LLEC1_05289 [Akanthomyces lecanii]
MAEHYYDPSLSSRFPAKHAERIFEWHDTGTVIDKAGLGKLGIFAFETVQQILVETDMRSLIRLQSVSKNMKRTVDTIREFHAVLRCAPDTIRIMTAAKVDSLLACRDLYNALCRPMCDLCDAPGIYLYLLACHRLCDNCLRTNVRYRPVRPLQATEQFDLPMDVVLSLPMLHVPKYSIPARRLRCSFTIYQQNTTGWRLIDRETARRRRLDDSCGSENDLIKAVADRLHRLDDSGPNNNKKQRLVDLHRTPPIESAYSSSVLFPWYDEKTGQIGLPALCRMCRDPSTGQTPRYMTEGALVAHQLHLGCVRPQWH